VKKPLFITIVILFLVTGGYFLFSYYFSNSKLGLWDLVPTETVLVYETSECQTCLEELKKSPVVQIIKKASFPETDKDTLKTIQDFILSFQQPTLVSLHITKKDEFDFAYFLEYTPNFQQKILILLQQVNSIKGLKESRREFNTVPINEITFNKKTFSWVLIENIWVGSFSPVLIEDVIRTYRSEERNSFKDVISSVYQLPRIKNDGGNLYVHLSNLSRWFSMFTKERSNYLIDHFGHSALLDSKIQDKKLVLNGFSYHPLNKKEFFLSAFQEQTPVEFKLKNIISNRTLFFTDFGISDGAKFFPRLNQLSKNPHADSLKLLAKSLNINPTELVNSFSGEVSVCHLESRKEELTKILLINDEKNISEWFKTFQAMSKNNITDSVFIDRYSDYEIFEIPLNHFPEKIFYPLVSGFANCYYTRIGNTLCLGENIEELKKFLDDIDQENTWGKSVAQNKFLESTLLESSVSIFINTPKIWNLLSSNLQPKWRNFVDDNKALLGSLGMASVQFSHLNETYYTNISWSAKDQKPANTRDVTNRYITNFDHGLASFATAKSHLDGDIEVLAQDSLKTLSLISSEGKILWQKSLPDFIAGEIHQIDFFNNGKLQFFFATPGTLHVIDRLGNDVKPFPVSIPETKIDHVSIIDYDHSKKYRFLIASTEGKLWMYDKNGKNLDGWQPRAVDEKLITSVNHHRILGKDYLMAIRTDGLIFLMNRRGELVKNFPLDLNNKLTGNYFLEIGKKNSDTYFTVVSIDGVKYQFNMLGKIENQDVLLKNSVDARFTLVSEKNFKSYIILRREQKQFTVFDEKSNEIIKSDFIANNPVSAAFYSYGNGRDYIVITDLSQQLSFIYDKKGKLITSIPIDSNSLRVFPTDHDRIKVYYTNDKNLTITELP
jgi:hypothetical protein